MFLTITINWRYALNRLFFTNDMVDFDNRNITPVIV